MDPRTTPGADRLKRPAQLSKDNRQAPATPGKTAALGALLEGLTWRNLAYWLASAGTAQVWR